MLTDGPIFFLADAHLKGSSDPNQLILQQFLNANHTPHARLVILGDLFDYMAGPNQAVKRTYANIIDTLKNYAPIDYIEGNHDFDLSDQVLGCNTANIHPFPTTLCFQGLSIYAFHGDRTSPTDIATRLLRRTLQSPPIRALRDRIVPDQLALDFALAFARFSRKKTWPGRSKEAGSVRKRAILELCRRDVDLVVFAHTHEALLENTQFGVIANPGAAEPGGSFLKLEHCTLSLHRFPDGQRIQPEPIELIPDTSRKHAFDLENMTKSNQAK